MRESDVRYMNAVGGLSHNLVVVKQSRTKTMQHSVWDQNMLVFHLVWMAKFSGLPDNQVLSLQDCALDQRGH